MAMKIYTVTSTDDLPRDSIERLVIGSWTSRDNAIRECAKYIMERISLRSDFAWSMAHDENHEDAARFFCEKKNGTMVVKRGKRNDLMDYLCGELNDSLCYYVWDCDYNSWHFDIDENDLIESEVSK